MDIQFDGFQNSIPLFWIFVILLAAIGLSVWTYWKVEALSTGLRRSLITLRAVAFIILILLLLKPVISVRDQIASPVRIVQLLDNSQSTAIEKGEYGGKERYDEVLYKISPDQSDRFEYVTFETFGFDSKLLEFESSDDLVLDGTRTNINQALVDFLEIYDDQDAVILVSDGIVTSGRDPGATASRMPVPIYTIGIGDTTRRNDIAVQRISHNSKASLNSRMRIEASILNDGFPDQDIEVQLLQNDEVLSDTTIRSSESRSVQQVPFDLTLDEEGLQQFQIHVPEVEGEWTSENNTRFFSVDVLDDRIRILHLAYDIHPDVKSMRSFLRKDKQISLENRTWISEDRYVEGELPDEPDTLDLVIFHGFPNFNLDRSHASEVADRFESNALLFVGSPGQEVSLLSSIFQDQLPLGFDSEISWYDVQFRMQAVQQNHAILDFESAEDFRTPPIRGSISNVTEHSNATTLLYTTYRGSETDTPLLTVRSVGGRNIAHFNAFNFYRWSLATDQATRSFWDNLLNNTVKWTAASPDEQLLELRPSEQVVQIGDPVMMNAYLRNEAGEPEADGVINLTIENDDIEDRSFVMNNEGQGEYMLEIGNLPEGVYSYRGVAKRGDREIESRTGQFTIGGVNREFLNTVRDDDLLETVAGVSGGSYLPHDRAHEMLDIIENDIGFDQRHESTTYSVSLLHSPLWFVIVIMLLALEWGLRKYRALA